MRGMWICLIGLCFACVGMLPNALALELSNWPSQPTDAHFPGSSAYSHDYQKHTVNLGDRTLSVYEPLPHNTKLPVVAFSHGHMVPEYMYEATFVHLAQKGVAVIYTDADKSFLDSDFKRMGEDYLHQVTEIVRRNAAWMDASRVVFSGHSNGAHVAMNAAGNAGTEAQVVVPMSVLVFETAGVDADVIRQIPLDVPVSLIVGDQDTDDPYSESLGIYQSLVVPHKQLIQVVSEPNANPPLIANHGFMRTANLISSSITPLHYFGSWKFLTAAALEKFDVNSFAHSYLYGPEALWSGWDSKSYQRLNTH